MTLTTVPCLRLWDPLSLSSHWVVEDEDSGEWWLVPVADDGWARRQKMPAPFHGGKEVAAGYCYMGLGIPIRREWPVVCRDQEGRN